MRDHFAFIMTVAGCVLFACTLYFWNERNRLQAELAQANTQIDLLQAARDADNAATVIRHTLTQKGKHHADQKRKDLDRVEKDTADLGDIDFLQSLRGVLYKSADTATADTTDNAP